ncbi:TadE/TadG family type IV pilus assembly protein [Adhaeretor mobilis]|uniref:TadE-like protein n=1 Tax=Adhaeretor mobilis TaxID=1930276 RepID=A0A517MTB5_9BACT|nr:TadE family protein [Adhaeretor mobilis]QDS98131.1 TadE-like protein [Adhaeretor mobilis]
MVTSREKRTRRAAITHPATTRRGAAATELAVCLPIITLVVFGSIQACGLVYLKHTATSAAYEATLELAKPNASNASVLARATQVLAAMNVTGGTVEILPENTNIAQATAGDAVSIVVTVPASPNLVVNVFFMNPDLVIARLAATR